MSLARVGIGARLFIAFLVITAVSLSSGIAGWIALREISGAQSRLISQALPAVVATQRMAEASTRLVAAAHALTAALDEDSRRRQEALLFELEAEIRQGEKDAGLSSLGGDGVAELSRTIEKLTANLSRQNALVRERIALDGRFRDRAVNIIAAATAIVDLSETLVSNASAGTSAVIANLYGLLDDPRYRDQAYDALDRLIEQDIYLLGGMFELRLRSSQIGLLINQLTRAISDAETARIAAEYRDHLRVIRRRVGSIADPVRRQQASGFLAALEAAAGASPWDESLFGQRQRLIDIGRELDLIAAGNADLAGEVSRVAQAMVITSEGFAGATAAQAGDAVDTGFYSLLISSLVAIATSGLIVWLYVNRQVVRRLRSLTTAMQRLTDGDLNVDVTDEGTHELKALSRAVRAFRDESKHRRALELERERTAEELRRHREELQVLVGERTRQLQDANAKLQQEVAKHAEAREKAEIANRAKSDFLATMSHEIRTPMTGMLGMLRILSAAPLSREQRHRLDVATSSGEALLGILNSILDYSKIESGRIAVEPVRFNLKDTIKGVIELMRPSAAEKGLKLRFSCDASLSGDHLADAGKLRQIVFNLVSNAIKFTERGRVSVAVRRLGTDAAADRVVIAVADSGIGIAPAEIDHIFEPFTQADASTTRRFGGTGLGLAISRRLAERMGGSLTVKSAPQAGSYFCLTMTLPQAETSPLARETVRQPRRRGPALRILAVEDDPATRIVVQSFLESLGHHVLVAVDGYKAVELAEREMPDLVILDVSLPGMDGPEVARHIRAIDGLADVPVLAMSAHVYRDEVASYLRAGMDGFVGKPLTPEDLAEALDAIDPAPRARPELEGTSAIVDCAVLDGDLAALGRATVERILNAAERTLPEHLSVLRGALVEGDLARAAGLAHAICSAAGAAGFSALHASAVKLEDAVRAGDETAAQRHLAACEALYPQAMATARRLVVERV
jgi:two-component system sensor histidine kinase TorS